MPNQLQQLEGKYEVLEKLHDGGMGSIYKVRHRLLEEHYVVKTMRQQWADDEQFRHRFLKEAKVAANMGQHPNIAQIHDFTIDNSGTGFIVMEFIDGVSFKEIIAVPWHVELSLVLRIARQALRALGFLHREGYVHRDISPDNILLTKDVDGLPEAKLIDLGIAKKLSEDDGLTSTGQFLGKLRYASPEHFGTNGAAGAVEESDVYCFGLVLYELLTGHQAILGQDIGSLALGHVHNPPQPFSKTDPVGRVPEELRAIVLQALEKAPENRFEDAQVFADALEVLEKRYPIPPSFDVVPLIVTLQNLRGNPEDGAGTSTQMRLDRNFGSEQTPSGPPGLLHPSRPDLDETGPTERLLPTKPVEPVSGFRMIVADDASGPHEKTGRLQLPSDLLAPSAPHMEPSPPTATPSNPAVPAVPDPLGPGLGESTDATTHPLPSGDGLRTGDTDSLYGRFPSDAPTGPLSPLSDSAAPLDNSAVWQTQQLSESEVAAAAQRSFLEQEAKKREAKEQAEQEAREREAREQAAREAREREERERERAEQEAREREERQRMERESREQAEREAREREERERIEREAEKREARERAERETREREAREREQQMREAREREAREHEARERAEREARDRAAKERAERQSQERQAPTTVQHSKEGSGGRRLLIAACALAALGLAAVVIGPGLVPEAPPPTTTPPHGQDLDPKTPEPPPTAPAPAERTRADELALEFADSLKYGPITALERVVNKIEDLQKQEPDALDDRAEDMSRAKEILRLELQIENLFAQQRYDEAIQRARELHEVYPPYPPEPVIDRAKQALARLEQQQGGGTDQIADTPPPASDSSQANTPPPPRPTVPPPPRAAQASEELTNLFAAAQQALNDKKPEEGLKILEEVRRKLPKDSPYEGLEQNLRKRLERQLEAQRNPR